MKCPVDDTELAMSERQGIEVDYCPKCRGVWLDRGELDKIIERSSAEDGQSKFMEQTQYPEQPKHREDDRKYGSQRPYKKKSLLGEIFDF
jgi:Zn-finger nucleic acid-binding protein